MLSTPKKKPRTPSRQEGMPQVSVVIVSYNTRDLTLQSIGSVYGSSGYNEQDLEIIVIDNNSADGSLLAIKKTYPKVICIANPNNVGFGAANNQGIARARGKFVLLLNSDAYLHAESLGVMHRLLVNSDLAAVGPRLVYGDGSSQPSAGYFPTPRRVTAWMLGLDKLPIMSSHAYHLHNPAWYQFQGSPDWLMGACILFRKSGLKKVGGFDEQMFMYAEEVELFLRLNQKVLYTPEATVTHLGGKSGGTKLISELKGIEYIYRKHYPGLYWYLKLVLNFGIILRILVFSLMPSKKSTVKEYRQYL